MTRRALLAIVLVAALAAAIAYVLMIAIMCLTLIQLAIGRRWVYYAS